MNLNIGHLTKKKKKLIYYEHIDASASGQVAKETVKNWALNTIKP